jgi:putative transposase
MQSQAKPGPTHAKCERDSVRTLRLRIKDKNAKYLHGLAFDANQVWNFCNALSVKVFERERRFMSGYDLQKYTNGASKEGLRLHSQTVQAVASEYATRRKQFRKVKLAWRKSGGVRRSLGWIPFKASGITYDHGQICYGKVWLSLWDSYGFEAQRFYQAMEDKLALAQRANKKDRGKAIHARIDNRRKDFYHKLSTSLVRGYGAIFVGNVNASALAKTNQAKSVLDAGWSAFRNMLRYKCDDASTWFEEVNEAYSTQTCSACHARSGPKGLQDLGSRITDPTKEWVCSDCGTMHQRDHNAAKNILAAGHRRLAVGIPVLTAQAAATG